MRFFFLFCVFYGKVFLTSEAVPAKIFGAAHSHGILYSLASGKEFVMKRNSASRKCLCLLIAALFAVLLSSSFFAADIYKSIPLSQNKTAAQKSYTYTYNSKTGISTYTYYRYKITIPAGGYITVTTGKGKTDSEYREVSFYRKLNDEDSAYSWWIYGTKKNGVFTIPIDKGTYYLRTYDNHTIKYKFTKVQQKPNYCVGKAVPLKKNQKALICQTPLYNYSRWYKIQLPKKQAVNIWFDEWNRASLYDSGLHYISMEHAGTNSPRYFSTEKLPKGTYYIRVERNTSYSDWSSFYTGTLRWN